MELYEMTIERQSRLMKTLAGAMGADVSDTSEDSKTYDIAGANDLGFLPISLGYETIE